MRGLRVRLALALSAMVLLLLGSVAAFSWSRIGEIARAQAEAAAVEEVENLVDASAPSLADPGALQSLAKSWAASNGRHVSIFNQDGTLIADSAPLELRSPAGPEVQDVLNVTRPDVIVTNGGEQRHTQRLDPVFGQETFFIASPIRSSQERWAARIGIPVAELERNAQPFRRLLVTTTAIVAVLGVLLAFVVARLFASPFRALTRSVESGEILRGPVFASGSEEARALARGLNNLAERARDMVATTAAEHGRLSSILDNITEAILVTDAQERVQLLNPAAERLLGTRAMEAQGRPVIEAIRDYEIAETLRAALTTQHQAAREVEVGPDRRPIRVVAAPYQVGGAWQVVLVAYDLTDVAQAQRMRREFLANVSHELRTPLAAVHATLEALEMGAIDDPTVSRNFLANARAEIQRMSGLVEGLLELTRIEMGWSQLDLAATDIGPVLERAVSTLSVLAAQANVNVDLRIPDGLPLVRADHQRIHQVAVNLLHNAVKFTPPGGRVTVSAHHVGEEVHIAVADTGQGIAPDDLPILFERFFRGERPSGRGAGLGLAIAKQIVEAHGGRIWADSQLGEGSTFTFSLAVDKVEAS